MKEKRRGTDRRNERERVLFVTRMFVRDRSLPREKKQCEWSWVGCFSSLFSELTLIHVCKIRIRNRKKTRVKTFDAKEGKVLPRKSSKNGQTDKIAFMRRSLFGVAPDTQRQYMCGSEILVLLCLPLFLV